MTVPTYDKFIEPVLRYLAAHPDGVRAQEAHEAAARALAVSDSDRQVLLPSGAQYVYKNRAGWAHDRLKRAGLSESPRRGFWKLTPEGSDYVASHPGTLSPEEVEKLAIGYIGVRLRPQTEGEPLESMPLIRIVDASAALSSPDDRLGEAIAELRRNVAEELLAALSAASPGYFEVIVLDVLHRMGYGASRADLQRVGGVGDGGIDGVISLDKLGLEKVYVQAKRWQSVVGRPDVQSFYGALAGQHANKGVFITTSSFTAQAIDFANSVERVVLLDGPRLAELMIDYEVGVSSRTEKIPRFDTDYFDEEST